MKVRIFNIVDSASESSFDDDENLGEMDKGTGKEAESLSLGFDKYSSSSMVTPSFSSSMTAAHRCIQ